ncbi:MAG: exopolysaccharide biosynthesis polyprenyl glycosylphosphotransferase [Kiritimatiellaeota bacterium]|nr:exopolysaccharide biosynthesis polyprenyl glycosylphosphotransferase [Kiritimatiellota bacterium]
MVMISQRPFSYWRRFVSNTLVLLVFDSLALLLALWIARVALYWLHDIPVNLERGLLIIPAWWVGSLLLRVTPGWGEAVTEQLRRKVLLISVIYGMVVAAMFIIRGPAPRIAVLFSYVLSLLLLPAFRILAKRWLINWGRWGLPVVVYGTSRSAKFAVHAMRDEPGLGYSVIGVFDDEAQPGEDIGGAPVLGRLVDHTPAAAVAVWTIPVAMSPGVVSRMLGGPLAHYRKVVLLPDILEIPTLWVRPRDFLGILGLEMASNLLNPLSRAVKTVIELALTLLTLPLWLPLMGLISLLIWIEDRHAPFYTQLRLGKQGRPFRVIKFRSMVFEAERVLQERLAQDAALRTEWEANRKLKRDPRVTRIGRWLRISSLDELPQLFNVLAGQMTLVGPRPLPEYHQAGLSETTRQLREQVRPGITGLWQVSGRAASGTTGLERWDAYYVRNWSFWLDIVILARTIKEVFSGRGAY